MTFKLRTTSIRFGLVELRVRWIWLVKAIATVEPMFASVCEDMLHEFESGVLVVVIT